MKEYMTDIELLDFISDIENKDLVKAPPGLSEAVLERIDKRSQIIEYKRFRNKVIAGVAAILILVPVGPGLLRLIPENKPDFIYNGFFKIQDTEFFDDFGQSHYISDFLNGRED